MIWKAITLHVVLTRLHVRYLTSRKVLYSSSALFMAGEHTTRASFSVDPDTLSFERKKYYITRNLEVYTVNYRNDVKFT